MKTRARSLAAAALALALSACTLGSPPVLLRTAKNGAAPGGTLTLRIGRPASIDPANSFERWGRFVDSLICDPLITLDPVTGDPRPAIASSWIVSNGGTQITLKLRKGVRYQDGTRVTADDVAFALTRVASEEEGSNVADALRPIAGWAYVHGDAEAKDQSQLDSLAGVHAIGTDAVQITLDRPLADFYRVLAQPLAAPEPRARVARDPSSYEQRPVCTGPYMLTKPWSPDDTSISLVRFPGYYGQNDAYTRGGRGYADAITLLIGDEAAPPPATADAAAVTRAVPRGARASVAGPAPYAEDIGLPVTVAPFDRRAVRIALSQAIDRSAIARDVYGGVRTPARSFLPPALGSISHGPACGPATPLHGDVAAARRTLASEGISLRGARISIAYNPDFDNAALVSAVAAQWRAAFGAVVTTTPVPWARYLDTATSSTGFRTPFRMGWEPEALTPYSALVPPFLSGNTAYNFTRFSDPRFDRAVDKDATRATNDEDLRNAYRHLEDILCEQMPAIPVVFGGARYLIGSRIDTATGTWTDITSGALLARELFVRRG